MCWWQTNWIDLLKSFFTQIDETKVFYNNNCLKDSVLLQRAAEAMERRV